MADPLREDLLDEVRAFLRAEMTARRTWRRRTWLGRRAAFALLEAVVLARWRGASSRTHDDERHRFVAELLEALEATGALDLITAGRWAEEAYEDPTEATRPVEGPRWSQQAPGEGQEHAQAKRVKLRR